MAIILIQTRSEDFEIPTPIQAVEANQITQSQLFDKELAFLCVENHAFSKSEITHVMIIPEDEEAQEEPIKQKENEECYMD